MDYVLAVFDHEQYLVLATELVANLLNPLERHFLLGFPVFGLKDITCNKLAPTETARTYDPCDVVVGDGSHSIFKLYSITYINQPKHMAVD